jgi:hypothetical protein
MHFNGLGGGEFRRDDICGVCGMFPVSDYSVSRNLLQSLGSDRWANFTSYVSPGLVHTHTHNCCISTVSTKPTHRLVSCYNFNFIRLHPLFILSTRIFKYLLPRFRSRITLKIEAAGFGENWAFTYDITQCHNSEDHSFKLTLYSLK